MKTIDLSKQQDVLKLHRSISSLLQITEDFDKAEAIGECTVFLCSLYHVKSFGLPLSRLDKSTAIKRMIEELYE